MIFDNMAHVSLAAAIVSGGLTDSGSNHERAQQSEAYHLASGHRKESSLYSSTASTTFDVITKSDPSAFTCLVYEGRKTQQIWDKRVDGEPIVSTFSFLAHFGDGSSVQIAINPEFGSVEAAQTEAMRYVHPIGQLPAILREGVQRISVHMGKEAFHAGSGQIVAYSEMTSHRKGHHHLEETIFHELVHASLDDRYRLSPEWEESSTRRRWLSDRIRHARSGSRGFGGNGIVRVCAISPSGAPPASRHPRHKKQHSAKAAVLRQDIPS